MIHLGAALLCDAATIRENLLHVLGGGVTHLLRQDFPAPVGADVVLTLYVDDPPGSEVSHTVAVECFAYGDSTDEVFGFEYLLNTTLGDNVGAQSASIVLPTANLGIPAPGRYEIKIAVDGTPISVIPFSAVQA